MVNRHQWATVTFVPRIAVLSVPELLAEKVKF